MDYRVEGDLFPCLIVNMEAGESLSCDVGAMAWMTRGIKMSTGTNGGIKRALGRLVTGETVFNNKYIAERKGMISFTPNLIGTILPLEFTGREEVIVQRTAMFVQTEGIDSSVHLQKNIFTGLLSGESFVLTKLKGVGHAWLEIDGRVVEYRLKDGQELEVSTGNFAAMDSTCHMDIVRVKGVANMFLGGEGLANVRIQGPGRVWLQTGSTKDYILQTASILLNRS